MFRNPIYAIAQEHLRRAESLSKQLKVANDKIVEGFGREFQQNCKIEDLVQRLAAMTEERDALQLRLHAVDHAYNEQQKAPALAQALKHNDELMKTVIRQRQFIRTLYTSRAKKKAKTKTNVATCIAMDMGALGGDRCVVSWRCECGNTGWTDVTRVEQKDWNCLKCGRLGRYIAPKQP